MRDYRANRKASAPTDTPEELERLGHEASEDPDDRPLGTPLGPPSVEPDLVTDEDIAGLLDT
jgi:hypothetical protein